jgi:2-phospho-L-lactate transferase/gluconeogenesis factor (CofD/UPF0052 family)
MNVTIIAGGRGSASITTALIQRGHKVTIVENAYDDGKSTGYIRRYFDILGPSDIRKAQSLGLPLNTPENVRKLFDLRITESPSEGMHVLRQLATSSGLRTYFHAFRDACDTIYAAKTDRFQFVDMSPINCIYAGAMLHHRSLSEATLAMGEVLGTVVNVVPVSDTNLWLGGISEDGTVFHDEAAIVETRSTTRIRRVALMPSMSDQAALVNCVADEAEAYMDLKQVTPTASIEAIAAICNADVVIVAPGTMHSSIYPTLMHRGFTTHKPVYIVTNLQPDFDTPGYTSEDFVRGIMRHDNFFGGVHAIIPNSPQSVNESRRISMIEGVNGTFSTTSCDPTHDGHDIARIIGL